MPSLHVHAASYLFTHNSQLRVYFELKVWRNAHACAYEIGNVLLMAFQSIVWKFAPTKISRGRKICGFLSHSATLGCPRCLKTFPGGVGWKQYSGFDRQTWKSRTNSDHRSSIRKIQQAETITKRNELQSKYGCRYSVLLQLSYFDPVWMLVVDPMHNLFLVSAKHILKKVWSANDVLDYSKKETCQHNIQGTMDSMQVLNWTNSS